MERKARRVGLSMKLNILLVACLLMLASGLVAITYSVYCRKVDSIYFAQAERALEDVLNNHIPWDYTAYMRRKIDTDEFREVRAPGRWPRTTSRSSRNGCSSNRRTISLQGTSTRIYRI